MADTLLHNARIRTMDPTRPTAEWLLIRDGRIARVTNYYNLQDWIAQVST